MTPTHIVLLILAAAGLGGWWSMLPSAQAGSGYSGYGGRYYSHGGGGFFGHPGNSRSWGTGGGGSARSGSLGGPSSRGGGLRGGK
ncbi:hypothetical protein [Magnetofaba australis]|uniref:Uncharacterized protein n=1 Tax=Magnetofaba australis IT-1 TaxID=1434232 RepID=A0A1Y2K8S0_9PROT|nr:hypothetical protein [Magnetofaba australis]OSM07141.1 hypothetical protein MAIT1_03944 [Magnetofaba australis IT-1]